MYIMLCRNRVSDYGKWRAIFDSHADAHREAGLHVLHVLRDLADPSAVTFMFQVDDLDKARAFTVAAEAQQAAKDSGVIGTTEIVLLEG